jgi:hypothetical protein
MPVLKLLGHLSGQAARKQFMRHRGSSPSSHGTGSVWNLADRTAPLPRRSPSSSRSTSTSRRALTITSRSANCSRGSCRTTCHAVVAPMAVQVLFPISAPQNTQINAVPRLDMGRSNVPSISMSLLASPSGSIRDKPGPRCATAGSRRRYLDFEPFEGWFVSFRSAGQVRIPECSGGLSARSWPDARRPVSKSRA